MGISIFEFMLEVVRTTLLWPFTRAAASVPPPPKPFQSFRRESRCWTFVHGSFFVLPGAPGLDFTFLSARMPPSSDFYAEASGESPYAPLYAGSFRNEMVIPTHEVRDSSHRVILTIS